jgi:SAM-dependent methyltransferase
MGTTGATSTSLSRAARRFAIIANAFFPFAHSMRYLLTGRTFVGFGRLVRDVARYRRAEASCRSGFALSLRHAYPAMHDWFEQAGTLPRHYFRQDLWGARKVFSAGVPHHFDIGSRIDGFVAHCLSFTRVTLLDIRNLDIPVEGLSFRQTNCINMDNIDSDSIPSLSSFHAVEHFGLGRYGDPIDPLGHEKALREMQRVMAPGGDLYLGVPIGVQRLEFNAQRIFDPLTIVALFPAFELVEFSVIDDADDLHQDEDPGNWRKLYFGCGLFHFRKPARAR